MTDQDLYRRLPRMDEILEDPGVQAWVSEQGVSRELAREAATHVLDALREQIAEGLDEADLDGLLVDLGGSVARAGERILMPRLCRVVNGTGVIVHTNLGRSPWSRAAAERVGELTTGYLNLEFDLRGGARGGRDRPVGRYLERLLPGFDVAVVNNNAAAVLLMLNTMAQGKEVVVSRGQLVEIGGSFRIPEVMEKGFCRLREVGSTNRTRIDDFRTAVGPETGLLLAVHPSNYRMVGFTESVPLQQLVALGAEAGIPVAEDLGSGTLVDLSAAGLDEPTVAQSLDAGVDLVTFSGDKLLGGPQAGFVVGKRESVERIRDNALYRALRLDKATFLALEATLRDYVAGRHHQIPTLAMIFASPEDVRERAEELLERLRPSLEPLGTRIELIETESLVGGGAAPEAALPSWGVAINSEIGPDELTRRLRLTDPPLIARVAEDRLVIDVRTLLEGDEERIEVALARALATVG